MRAGNGHKTGLRAARRRAGLAQRELAERCRVTRAAVGHWETGEAVPAGPSRVALSAALAVPLEVVDSWFPPARRVA